MQRSLDDAHKYENVLTLGDTGSTRCCISEDFYRDSPALRKYPFRPLTTRGTAINGTKVLTIGICEVPFRINGTYMRMNCRVVKGLVQPFILGWDFFSKYSAKLNAQEGLLEFANFSPVSLVKNSDFLSGCYYRVHEDLTVPANSKMHKLVELMADKEHVQKASKTVVTEPFANVGSDVWSCRVASEVNDCMFLTEFVNCSEYPVKLEAGRVLGRADFCDPSTFDEQAMETEMYNSYVSEDSAYESGSDGSESGSDEEECDEIVCDAPPSSPPKSLPEHHEMVTAGFNRSLEPPQPQDTPPPKPLKRGIPQGAKPLKVCYKKLAKKAVPYKKELQHLLEVKHEEALSKHDRDYGKTSLIQYRAHLKDPSAPPIAVPPYRTRPELRETIDEQAWEMIADGLVSHSKSAYSAPILLARKKCGGWRFLTDFRKVNDQCDKVVFPLPRIEDSLQKLDSPCIFSCMDLTKGFWQIPIHPDDRKYFAFSTENMHLEYLVAPMGAKNSPSYLSALMQLVLRGLPVQHIVSYLDDILVASSSMEQHLEHLDLVLTALEKAGLKLNPSKCSFAQDSVVCLGHKLSAEGVSPDPANVEKIRSWKAPENVKRLRSFLGLTGYYRQFVKDYSKVAQCLTDLTKDDVDWSWTPAHQEAFEFLRDTLTSDKIMSYPDFSKPFIVKSDASHSAIGYVLTQKADGKEKVILYGSKKLDRTQQNWSTYDREFFALLCAIRANAHYLRHAAFIAITDHRPLLAWKRMDSKKDPTGRRTRWAIELNTYEFELIYKKGRAHADADAMSRRGDDDDEVAVDSEEFFAFLGMACEDEYSAVKLNALSEEIDRLRVAQDDDPTISAARSFVRNRKKIPSSFPDAWYRNNSRWFIVRDGILYKKAYSETVHLKILQAVIPPTLTKVVMEDLHGSYMAGHPGIEKMLLSVKRYAVWPSINKDVKQFVADCVVCDQETEPTPANRTPRIPIKAENVWDHLICDLISLPVGSLGFHYVLVFVDVFSGYVKLYKLRDKHTKGVCKALEDITCTIGPPRLLTSDNGGEFTSDLLKEMCQVKGIQKRTSVSYRPQSNSPVERFNRTLISGLKKRLIQYGHSWVSHLPYVEWSYNNSPRHNTKMTPYFLVYGREAPLPLHAEPKPDSSVKDPNSKRFLEEVKRRTKEITDEARKRIEAKSAKDVEAYNKKAKHDPLVPGEMVYERVPDGTRDKLQSKWSGLLKVLRRRSGPSGEPGTTYVCERPSGEHVKRNYEQLKRSKARDPPLEDPSLVAPSRPSSAAPAAPPSPLVPAIPPAPSYYPSVLAAAAAFRAAHLRARAPAAPVAVPPLPAAPVAVPPLPAAPAPFAPSITSHAALCAAPLAAPLMAPAALPPPASPPASARAGSPPRLPASPPANEASVDPRPGLPPVTGPRRFPAPLDPDSALVDERLVWPPEGSEEVGGNGNEDSSPGPANQAGPSGLPKVRSISLISFDESPDGVALPEAAAAAKRPSRVKRGRPPSPSNRLTRLGLQQLRQRETAKSAVGKIAATVGAASEGSLLNIPEADESHPEAGDSHPDVFAPFGEDDLVRADIRMESFDKNPIEDLGKSSSDAEVPHPSLDHPATTELGAVDAPHAAVGPLPSWNPEMTDDRPAMAPSSTSADDNQATSRSSSILRPFNYFFGTRGDGAIPSTSGAATTAAPTEVVDSPLEDPFELEPQTSSTPKDD